MIPDATAHWTELGSPSGPGTYRVEGYGMVTVTDETWRAIEQAGGDPLIDLWDTTNQASGPVKTFRTGLIR